MKQIKNNRSSGWRSLVYIPHLPKLFAGLSARNRSFETGGLVAVPQFTLLKLEHVDRPHRVLYRHSRKCLGAVRVAMSPVIRGPGIVFPSDLSTAEA